MNSDQLSRNCRYTLRIALLAQMAHTVVTFVSGIAIALNSHSVLHDGRLEYLPWTESIPWRFIVLCAVALFIEIMIWRWLSELKPCALSYFTIMLAAECLYLLYLADTSIHIFRSVDVKVFELLDIFLLIAVVLGISSLFQSRKAFSLRRVLFLQIILAIISTVTVVFLKGHYYPAGAEPEYIISDVPPYFGIIALSNLQFPQESSMVLCVLLFALISKAFDLAGGWSKRQSNL